MLDCPAGPLTGLVFLSCSGRSPTDLSSSPLPSAWGVFPAAPMQLQPPSGGLALPLLWAQPSLILTPGDPGTAPAPSLTPALIFSTCKLPHFPGEWMGARTWLGNCHTPPCSLLDRTLLQDRDTHVRVPAEASAWPGAELWKHVHEEAP